MSTKLIACAFIITIACHAILENVDCASIRRKKQNSEQSYNDTGNWTGNPNGFKVDGQKMLFTDLVGANALSARIITAIASDVGNQSNFVAPNKSIKIQNNVHKAKKQLEEDDRIKLSVEIDPDQDDNNGNGDGAELTEVKNAIENIMKLNNFGEDSKDRKKAKDINGAKERRKAKDSNGEMLRFKSNDDGGKEVERKHMSNKNKAKPAHHAGQRSTLIPLKIDELQLPDHVDGLRMEHDGHLNREYKKEVFLGNHEEFEWESEKKLVKRLKDIFKRADKNHDDHIDRKELQSWIMLNVQSHLDEAVADNKRIFFHLDTNRDEFVTWKEFYIHFLLAKGHDVDSAKKQSESNDTLSLEPDEKERIIRYKFRWAEADEEPQDDRLTFDEFMNFRHPEQSKAMIVRMVKDLIHNFDKNGDEVITEEEFLMMSSEDSESAENNRGWLAERKKEFREVIDINRDGIVDEAELKVYVDPHNTNHAKLEAENLIQLADQNGDGRLTLSEVLENAELFLGSKVVDASRNFHDEF